MLLRKLVFPFHIFCPGQTSSLIYDLDRFSTCHNVVPIRPILVLVQRKRSSSRCFSCFVVAERKRENESFSLKALIT